VSDAILLFVPLAVLAVVALFGFVGCTKDFDSLQVGEDRTDEDETPPVPYADEVMSSDPIAYWRLSDALGEVTATDSIGPWPGNHPGTYVGNVALEQPGLNLSDQGATAAHFDGTGLVDVAHDPVFEMTQFTVEALVHPDSVVSQILIVSNLSSSGGWALTIVPPSPGDHPDIDGWFAPVVSDGSGPVGPPAVEFDLAKLGTAWHVAMTFDGTIVTLYWDGVQQVSGTWPAVGNWPYAPNTLDPLQIGVDFKGAIQEVAVYDAVLTAEQLNTHYLSNASPGE
jgi:Concanavalin A-like lectin/glucanases superfamily